MGSTWCGRRRVSYIVISSWLVLARVRDRFRDRREGWKREEGGTARGVEVTNL